MASKDLDLSKDIASKDLKLTKDLASKDLDFSREITYSNKIEVSAIDINN
jgi:hypothetical protein